ESDNLLNKYPTEKVYQLLKKDLKHKLHKSLVHIEEVQNSLSLLDNDTMWMEWINRFTRHLRGSKNLERERKKELLTHILSRVTARYDEEKKVHQMTLKFKIPVVLGTDKSCEKGSEIPKNLKISHNQLLSVRNYSTVTLFARFLG
ncbi:MAG: hypothetical protein ACKOQ6_08420, partial [Bacteroidota bacterium]